MKINLEIGLTPQLAELAKTAIGLILAGKTAQVATTDATTVNNTTAPEPPSAAPTPAPTPSAPVPVAAPVAPVAALAPAPVAPAPAPAPGVVPPPDDNTMRTMMDISISKLCGTNDWKESSDPAVIGRRRSITALFKQIASSHGAEKPTQLQGEARNRFISELDRIYINTQTGLAEWEPF